MLLNISITTRLGQQNDLGGSCMVRLVKFDEQCYLVEFGQWGSHFLAGCLEFVRGGSAMTASAQLLSFGSGTGTVCNIMSWHRQP